MCLHLKVDLPTSVSIGYSTVFLQLLLLCFCEQLYCPVWISPTEYLGCFPQGKPAATLPTLWRMLDVLAFPWSTELRHGLQDH